MIMDEILFPFFSTIFQHVIEYDTNLISICVYGILFYLTYIIINFVCKGVIKWYSWFMNF